MVLYLFTYPPFSPFLNSIFMRLDSAFPLFGTAAFAIFCFYLISAPLSCHILPEPHTLALLLLSPEHHAV